MAIYQASHPGLYLTPAPRSQTFALGGPGPDDLNTPLYPFRHSNGIEWTSDELKTADSIFSTGYAYPEVPNGMSASSLQTFATQAANKLYGPNLQNPSFVGNASGAAGTFSASLLNACYFSILTVLCRHSSDSPSRVGRQCPCGQSGDTWLATDSLFPWRQQPGRSGWHIRRPRNACFDQQDAQHKRTADSGARRQERGTAPPRHGTRSH